MKVALMLHGTVILRYKYIELFCSCLPNAVNAIHPFIMSGTALVSVPSLHAVKASLSDVDMA